MPPLKYVAEAVAQLAVEQLVAARASWTLEVLEARPDLVEPVDLALRPGRGAGASRARPPSRTLRRCVGLGALGLELGQVGLELLLPGLDRRRHGAARRCSRSREISASSEGRSRWRRLVVDAR